MSDQASELRKLVMRAMRDGHSSHGPMPRLVVVTSGQSGVGVTTLAVNLSAALAEQGSRVVLVDADATGESIAALCGLPAAAAASAEFVGAKRDIHEILQLGPAGIQIAPGLWAAAQESQISPMALERMVRQLTKLGRHADSVILDAGNGRNEFLRRLAQAADDVLVVTTPESSAITDAYAKIKLALSDTSPATLWLVVNKTQRVEEADEVHRRMNQSCERFLGHGIRRLGAVPFDSAVANSAQRASPLVIDRPGDPASRAVIRMAMDLIAAQRSQRLRSAA
jgi:flagellar biosynthesis protein FlhG